MSRPSLPALKRLIAYSETWAIEYHLDGQFWSAERREGSTIRYLAGIDTAELAALIDQAERGGS